MKKLLQINVTANWGSTGKIVEEIGKLALTDGYESWIAYGRGNPVSQSNLIRIGNDLDMKIHGIQTRLLDNHGLASKKVTKEFIYKIKEIKPDIIHLHNIHGYFMNYPMFFQFLKEWGGPVIWTLHDCWPFTGHCAHYTKVKCDKWETGCFNCPQHKIYPSSFFIDRSANNYKDKKKSFLSIQNLTLVSVSDWLSGEISRSFFNKYPILTIKNGIDLKTFCTIENALENKEKLILGVSSVWTDKKGLYDFYQLREILPEKINITLVGLTPKQIKNLPSGITGITRTENITQLVDLYNRADVFVNPSAEETFGLTTVEALACGTPSIVYNSTALGEAIDDKTGFIVEYGNVNKLAEKIKNVCENNPFSSADCRKRAEKLYDKNINFKKYMDLYQTLI